MIYANYANFFETTLSADVDDTATVINVSSATGSPTVPFVLLIENEKMVVTNKGGGTNWSVTRGFDSTFAASHNAAVVVSHVIERAALNAAKIEEISKIDVDANLPAFVANETPSVYTSTNINTPFFKGPSDWLTLGGQQRMNTPALQGTFTWDRQATGESSTITDIDTTNPNCAMIYVAAASTRSLYGKTHGFPGSFRVSALITSLMPRGVFESQIGLYVADSAANIGYGVVDSSTGFFRSRQVHRYSNVTNGTISAIPANGTNYYYLRMPTHSSWLQIEIDKTSNTAYYRQSTNGRDWMLIYSNTNAEYATFNRYGFTTHGLNQALHFGYMFIHTTIEEDLS